MKHKRLLLTGLFGVVMGIAGMLLRHVLEGPQSLLSWMIFIIGTTAIAVVSPLLPKQFGLVDRNGVRADRVDETGTERAAQRG